MGTVGAGREGHVLLPPVGLRVIGSIQEEQTEAHSIPPPGVGLAGVRFTSGGPSPGLDTAPDVPGSQRSPSISIYLVQVGLFDGRNGWLGRVRS